MEVQFAGRDGKILYCNDEVVRITKSGRTKEWKVKDLGQAVLDKNILFIGDIDCQLAEYVEIDPKKQINRTLKIVEHINAVGQGEQINQLYIQQVKKKKHTHKVLKLVATVVALLYVFVFASRYYVTKNTLDAQVESVVGVGGYSNTALSDGTYYAELHCISNDGALFAIHDTLLTFNSLHKKIGLDNITIVAKKGDRELYRVDTSHHYVKEVNFYTFDDIQTAKKILKIKDVNPLEIKWRKIKTFTGKSISKTSTFTVGEAGAKVTWNTSPGEYGDFNFIVFMYFENGDFADPYGIANVIGRANGESYIRTPGTYYFDVNTAQQYTITVQEPYEVE